MNRVGSKEWRVRREAGWVVVAMSEDTAAGLALILEEFEGRRLRARSGAPVTWSDLVADLRLARVEGGDGE